MNAYVIAGLDNREVVKEYFIYRRGMQIQVIIEEACKVFDVDPIDVVKRTRAQKVVNARHFVAWFLVNKLGMTLTSVGKDVLGGRDHTTVINSIRKFSNLYETEDLFKDRANLIMENITAWRKN
jgi:chromosomal replication initiation ATPase DnaA